MEVRGIGHKMDIGSKLGDIAKYGREAVENAIKQGISIARYLDNKARGFATEAARKAHEAAEAAKDAAKKIADSDAAKKAEHIAAGIGLAQSRVAFLIIVSLNAFNFARNMSRANQDALQRTWYKCGGEWELLKKSIDLGKNLPRPKDFVISKLKDLLGIGITGEAVAAIIAAATPIIIIIYNETKKEDPALANAIGNEANWSDAAIYWANYKGIDLSEVTFDVERDAEYSAAWANYNALSKAGVPPLIDINNPNEPAYTWPDGSERNAPFDANKYFLWSDKTWHTTKEPTNTGGGGFGLNLGELFKQYWPVAAVGSFFAFGGLKLLK